MRIGMRKPSIKKSFKARTTGKKGMGMLKDPERSVKNKIYKKTTFSIWDLFKK